MMPTLPPLTKTPRGASGFEPFISPSKPNRTSLSARTPAKSYSDEFLSPMDSRRLGGSMTSRPARKTSLPYRSHMEANFPTTGRSTRRNSLPASIPSADLALTLNLQGSGSRGKQKGVSTSRRGSVDSVDRDLHCMMKNGIEERRLQVRMQELERHSFAGTLEMRHQKNEVLRNFRHTLQTSPSADQWLSMRRSRTSSWQAREREDIARRYSRRLRQFRAPAHLQGTVAKIRTYALLEAGFLRNAQTARRSSVSGSSTTLDRDEEENISRMTSLNITRRRHTLCGDAIASHFHPPEPEDEVGKDFARTERRMTMGDIHILKQILDSQTNDDLANMHDDDENVDENDSHNNSDNVKVETNVDSVKAKGTEAEEVDPIRDKDKETEDGAEGEVVDCGAKVEDVHSSDEFDSDDNDETWEALVDKIGAKFTV